MFFSFSIKKFVISAGFLLTCATTWAGVADDLMKNGDPRRMRLLLSELVDRIELSFTTHQREKQVRSKFDRGVIYVRPQLIHVSSETQGRL